MKFTVLALGAAVASISCVSPCSAQLNIEPSGATRLAYQNSQADAVFGPGASASSPSDYFGEDAPGEGLGDPQSILADQPPKFTGAAVGTQAGAPPSASPAQAAAQAPLGLLASTPEVGMMPICWPEEGRGCRTPNPVADMMMYTWCSDGLWDTYAAQRACQCAHIQQHTGGYNRYSQGCGVCANGGGCGACTPAHVWPTPMASNFSKGASPATLASGPQTLRKPVAQLVISPVLSAPTQLATAQAQPGQPSSALSLQPPPAQQQPQQPAPAREYRATPSPLPAAPMPTEVPVVASRATGFLR